MVQKEHNDRYKKCLHEMYLIFAIHYLKEAS